MNKWEKEVLASLLDSEEEVIIELEKQYKKALNDIGNKVKAFQADIDMLDAALQSEGLDDKAKEILKSQRRSKVYQKQFQEALQGQVSGILDQMQGNNYSTIESYLKQTYEDAYIGTMYDLHGQGIPIIAPIDQASAVKAILIDSKISTKSNTTVGKLYAALGVANLKKSISAEITRGIASSLTYADIARNLNNVSKAGLSNATRIVRTEGHRIQQTAANDARKVAKSKGADVVKQWDAVLDGRTRDTHRLLDGQIRELDEPFEVAGKKAMFPGDFGDPAEDCNCRCTADTRARWALDEEELKILKDRAKQHGLFIKDAGGDTKAFGHEKAKDFADFKKKYLKAVANLENDDKIKLSNREVREWYIDKVSHIADEIASDLSAKSKAKVAFLKRNQYREEARRMMADAEAREKLDAEHPNKTFEQLVESKMQRKGMTREEAIQDIYKTATTTNAAVNKELGVE